MRTATEPAAIRHHFVTHEGLRLLARTEAVPPLRHGEHAGLAVETSVRGRGGSRMRNLRRNFDHTLGVNAVVAHLAFDAQRAGHEPPCLLNEAQAAEHFRCYDRAYWIRPDAAGVYHLGDTSYPFLLEYDRGKMRRRDYLRKLAGLTAYFASELDRQSYGPGLTVLVVSESYGGEGRFADAVLAGQAQWGVELPLLLTTEERMRRNAHGLLGPIWRTADSTSRRTWLGDNRRGQSAASRRSSSPSAVAGEPNLD